MIHRLDFRAMGCAMQVTIETESNEHPAMIDQVPGWFEEWEQSLSRFRANSELNTLNRSAGSPMHVSQTLWDVMQIAIDADWISGGLVTPAVLDAIEAAGYDRSFEELSFHPIMQTMITARIMNRIDDIIFDNATRSITLPYGMGIDLGGVAKGWSANEAMRRLSHLGSVIVNAGGDLAISGNKLDGTAWDISVDDPFISGDNIELLIVPNGGGIATSGIDYRRWQANGRWNHHIIDPRTGLSADTDVLTATVIAPTVMEAEVAAKVAVIGGSDAGLGWLEERPSLAGLLILQNGDMLYTQSMQDHVAREE